MERDLSIACNSLVAVRGPIGPEKTSPEPRAVLSCVLRGQLHLPSFTSLSFPPFPLSPRSLTSGFLGSVDLLQVLGSSDRRAPLPLCFPGESLSSQHFGNRIPSWTLIRSEQRLICELLSSHCNHLKVSPPLLYAIRITHLPALIRTSSHFGSPLQNFNVHQNPSFSQTPFSEPPPP